MQAEGSKGGDNGNGNDIRRRNAAWGADTSRRIYPVAGVGNIHVDSAPIRERRWGAGVTERCGDNYRLLMGGQ